MTKTLFPMRCRICSLLIAPVGTSRQMSRRLERQHYREDHPAYYADYYTRLVADYEAQADRS